MAEFYDAVIKGVPIKNGTVNDAVRVMHLVNDIYKYSSLALNT